MGCEVDVSVGGLSVHRKGKPKYNLHTFNTGNQYQYVAAQILVKPAPILDFIPIGRSDICGFVHQLMRDSVPTHA